MYIIRVGNQYWTELKLTYYRSEAMQFEYFEDARLVAGKLDNAEIIQINYMVVWDNKA